MAFDSVSAFLLMGTHGVYVWSAYGFSILVLSGLVGQTIMRRRQVKASLKKRYLRELQLKKQAG